MRGVFPVGRDIGFVMPNGRLGGADLNIGPDLIGRSSILTDGMERERKNTCSSAHQWFSAERWYTNSLPRLPVAGTRGVELMAWVLDLGA